MFIVYPPFISIIIHTLYKQLSSDLGQVVFRLSYHNSYPAEITTTEERYGYYWLVLVPTSTRVRQGKPSKDHFYVCLYLYMTHEAEFPYNTVNFHDSAYVMHDHKLTKEYKNLS